MRVSTSLGTAHVSSILQDTDKMALLNSRK